MPLISARRAQLFEGPQGPTGPAGPPGKNGLPGSTGPAGADGAGFPVINVKDAPYSAHGDGTHDDGSALAAASAAAGSSGTILLPPGTYKISSNVTFNTKVRFDRGAAIKLDAGITLTVAEVEAGSFQQLFDVSNITNTYSAGGVRFSKPSSTISVKWFGAVGDGVADDTKAIQAALDVAIFLFGDWADGTLVKGGAVEESVEVWVPQGKYLLSDELGMQDGVRLRGDYNAILVMGPSHPGVNILRIGAYHNWIEGIAFAGGKSAIVCNGHSNHYSGNIGTVTAGAPFWIKGCTFRAHSGPAIYLDTTLEHRSSSAALFVEDCDFYTASVYWGGFDGCAFRNCYVTCDTSGASIPQALDDDGKILATFNSFDALELQQCVMVPGGGPTDVWIAGTGFVRCINTRFGGEAQRVIWRAKYGITYNGRRLGDDTDPQATPSYTFWGCNISSCTDTNFGEVYDKFPCVIDVKMPMPGISANPRPFLAQSFGVWIDSVTVAQDDYNKASRATVSINWEGWTSDLCTLPLKFRTSADPTDLLGGTDVTAMFRRFWTKSGDVSVVPAVQETNLFPAGKLDASDADSISSSGNITTATNDTSTNYTIHGYRNTGSTNDQNLLAGFDNFCNGLAAGEYTVSCMVKADFTGQFLLVLADAGTFANSYHIDGPTFSASSEWQRVSTTFWHDGSNKAVFFNLFDIAAGGHIWYGFFALHRGRAAAPWTYPQNATAQDRVASLYYGSAAPVSGTYAQGDVVLNTNPTSGSPLGWVCTVAGSPGTFVQLANVGGGPAGAAAGNALSGTYPNPDLADNLHWKNTQTPVIDQASTTSGTAVAMVVKPQRSTAGTRTDGSWVLDLGPSTAGGAAAYMQIQVNDTLEMQLGQLTQGGSFYGLWLSRSAPDGNNYSIVSDANNTYVNAPTTVAIRIANGGNLVTVNANDFNAIMPTLCQLASPDNYLDQTTLHIRTQGGSVYGTVDKDGNGHLRIQSSDGTINLGDPLDLENQTTSATATGGAATVPALAQEFLTVTVNGNTRKIALFLS